MKSILDISVSGFANYQSTEPVNVNLYIWLNSGKYADRVNGIRATSDKAERDKLKAMLPAITPSGVFSERKAAGLIKHSGFIQFDIDGVNNLEATKAKIISLSNVAYCGLSVSGRGLWGLIPITEPEHHKEYFELIEKTFASMGITIDKACKDVSRLRGYSYDPDAYFNHNAKALKKWYKPQKKQFKPLHRQNYNGSNDNKVEVLISEICRKGIDLTANYSDWFSLGCSLANEFGEAGRSYFHSISQFHQKYNPTDTDNQFNQCLNNRYDTPIGYFFKVCRNAGIMYKDFYTGIKPKNETRAGSNFNRYSFGGHIGTIPVIPVADVPVKNENNVMEFWPGVQAKPKYQYIHLLELTDNFIYLFDEFPQLKDALEFQGKTINDPYQWVCEAINRLTGHLPASGLTKDLSGEDQALYTKLIAFKELMFEITDPEAIRRFSDQKILAA